MIIRICTEYKNHERVRELCAKRFDAFTIYYGLGGWKGKLEASMTIEIAVLRQDADGRNGQKFQAVCLCNEIKKLNDQEAVLLQYIEAHNELI
jgi:hypothetical protein